MEEKKKIRINNMGVSLLELIVAISIMVVLVGIIAPAMTKYVEKARKARVETEASEFIKAAQIAYVSVAADGNEPLADCIKHKTKSSSPYYRNGTLYGNLTNWTVHNGVVDGASNAAFAEELFPLLNIKYGQGWSSGSGSIAISSRQPKLNPAGSLTNECIFQVFYDKNGNMIVEYSRDGYFVRMENSLLVESVKIKNSAEMHFTGWQ